MQNLLKKYVKSSSKTLIVLQYNICYAYLFIIKNGTIPKNY